MSLFNRPSWAKTEVSRSDAEDEDEDDEPANIFSHSREFRARMAEKARREKERAERKEAKDTHCAPVVDQEAKEEEEPQGKGEDESYGASAKRRRITGKEGENLLGSLGLFKPVAHDDDDDQIAAELGAERSPRGGEGPSNVVPPGQSPRTNRNKDLSGKTASPRRSPGVVELRDSDDEDNQPPAVDPGAPEEESEDEFAELRRKTRETQRQNEALANSAGASHTPGSESGQGSTAFSPPPDPTIKLFLSSPIPNTTPLIVCRRLSQRLREVREAWCQKQNFSPDFTSQVFFTYRLRRVYDVTTCRSLGLEMSQFGDWRAPGSEEVAGAENVHLEAMTEQLWRDAKERRDRERRGEAENAGGGESEVIGGAEPSAPDEERIRVVLKAKARKDFQLRVRPVSRVVLNLSLLVTWLTVSASGPDVSRPPSHALRQCTSRSTSRMSVRKCDSNLTARSSILRQSCPAQNWGIWTASMSTSSRRADSSCALAQ